MSNWKLGDPIDMDKVLQNPSFEGREYYGKYRIDNYNDDEGTFAVFTIDKDSFRINLNENLTLEAARAFAKELCAKDAALELLEALEACLDVMTFEASPGTFNKARAAIAKAKGE